MEIFKKFLSRKFLAMVAALVIGVFEILEPSSQEQAGTVSNTLVELILMGSPLVYIIIEGIGDIVTRGKSTSS